MKLKLKSQQLCQRSISQRSISQRKRFLCARKIVYKKISRTLQVKNVTTILSTFLSRGLLGLLFWLAAGLYAPIFIEQAGADAAKVNSSTSGPRLRLDKKVSSDESFPEEKRYQRISKTGRLLSDHFTDWSCVRDIQTNLFWEKKFLGKTIHNKDIEFRWGGEAGVQGWLGKYVGENIRVSREKKVPPEFFFNDWDYLIEQSNKEKLCGFDDWRVPSLYELASLVECESGVADLDLGCNEERRSKPTINQVFFPNSMPDTYWTSSLSSLSETGNHAWTIHFSSGSDVTMYRGSYNLVRLVRGPVLRVPLCPVCSWQ